MLLNNPRLDSKGKMIASMLRNEVNRNTSLLLSTRPSLEPHLVREQATNLLADYLEV
jgi:hypothetical protein